MHPLRHLKKGDINCFLHAPLIVTAGSFFSSLPEAGNHLCKTFTWNLSLYQPRPEKLLRYFSLTPTTLMDSRKAPTNFQGYQDLAATRAF
jgi:hypothetical protein